jgi:hypothetical protein
MAPRYGRRNTNIPTVPTALTSKLAEQIKSTVEADEADETLSQSATVDAMIDTPSPIDDAIPSDLSPVEGTDPAPIQNAIPPYNPQPAPPVAAVAPVSAPVSASVADTPAMDSINLSDFVAKLSPEQLSRIRTLAAAKGLAPSGMRTDKYGNAVVEITIDADLTECIKAWAEAAEISFQAQCQQLADYLFPGFLIGGMGIPDIAPATAAVTSTVSIPNPSTGAGAPPPATTAPVPVAAGA